MESIKKFSLKYLEQLLKAVIDFKEIELDIPEKIIEVDARTAYRYALCTQSTYLDEEYAGVYIKKEFSSFNMRNLELSSGIYEFKNNFLIDIKTQKIPNIFRGKKRIILKEGRFDSEEISDIYCRLVDLQVNTSDYLLVFVDPNGGEWEQFYEFYLSEYFIKKNQITDIQIPWPYGGTPDFSYYTHKFTNLIGGFLVPELCNIRYFLDKNPVSARYNVGFYNEMSIVEVKSSQKTSQAKKYIEKKITNSIYEFFPDGKKNNEPLGLYYLEDFELREIKSIDKNISNKEDQKWFNKYLKINLLANLKLEEIQSLLKNKSITRDVLITSLENISLNEILGKIKNGL